MRENRSARRGARGLEAKQKLDGNHCYHDNRKKQESGFNVGHRIKIRALIGIFQWRNPHLKVFDEYMSNEKELGHSARIKGSIFDDFEQPS